MDTQRRTATPTPSTTGSWTARQFPTTPDMSSIPHNEKTSGGDSASKPPGESSLGEPIIDTVVALSLQSQPSPKRPDPASTLPRVIIIYQNGCNSRLHSIYDRKAHKHIYHHDRDANKPIKMAFTKGHIESLQDIRTGDFLYIRSITHKKEN
ncbi:hypothetical protein F4814DRAFT_460457 [Daldinia grandis]|nr:hypothetical protein F4814DRAFT_460457 [Daldinia grandis]